jgi:hypothetical protein
MDHELQPATCRADTTGSRLLSHVVVESLPRTVIEYCCTAFSCCVTNLAHCSTCLISALGWKWVWGWCGPWWGGGGCMSVVTRAQEAASLQ